MRNSPARGRKFSPVEQWRKTIRGALSSYYNHLAPGEYGDADIDNLVEQAMPMLDEVLDAYIKAKEPTP